MAHGGSDGVDAGRLDLVPMIDCIMLLLIFFVMTTKFSTEEKAISSLLPTDKGQSGPGKAKDIKMVNICINPASPRIVKG
jgi:biopolymer transport protein ExbD